MSNQNDSALSTGEGGIPPHEAFAILANPDRFDIIRAIAQASEETLPFSDLYDRSNFDDSGQFTYHLNKLVDTFLRKTGDGYRLRHAARIVYRLAVSGLISDRGEGELATVEATCIQCGADQLVAVYEGDRFWIRCDDCGRRATVAPFPPRAVSNYDSDHVPAAFDRYTMGTVVRAAENVCPWCASALSPSLESADGSWPTVDWVIHRGCSHCQGWIYTRIHDLLRLHPAVVTFYYEHGVDILGSHFWEAEYMMAEETNIVTDTDGWSATATLTHDGDQIELGIAEDMRASTIELIATRTS